MLLQIVLSLIFMLIKISTQKDRSKERAALQVLLRGDSNETYRGIIIFNNNITYRLVPEHEHKKYDHTGAAYYVVAVVLVYGLSIILLIASHIKRKHKKFVEDRQINRYLQAAPSLKEKSAKARWKELKMSFIPITLATVAIGNSIAASEKHQLTTVSEETDDEVQELEAITVDTGYGNRQVIDHDDVGDGVDESVCLLNDTCDTTDDEVLVESVDYLNYEEGFANSETGNINGGQQVVKTTCELLDSPTHSGSNNKYNIDKRVHNNDYKDVDISYSTPVLGKYNNEDENGDLCRKTSLTHHIVSSNDQPVNKYRDNYSKPSEPEHVELPESREPEETWVKRSPPVQVKDEQADSLSRETQL